MTLEEKTKKLKAFQELIRQWQSSRDGNIRSNINQDRKWVEREVLEAGCWKTLTISPPPAVGGLLMRDVNPFDYLFDAPYGRSVLNIVIDIIDETLGVLRSPPREQPQISIGPGYEKGYVFIAMPIDPANPGLVDVLDALKEACKRCGLQAERVDEVASNERITDRILESIRKAEYVVADLTDTRPNVFYEAGYAHGLGKIPIYVARQGTKLQFDLKDYPVIFFPNMKQLKDDLEKRLRGLAARQSS
jgi:hypothetical protein